MLFPQQVHRSFDECSLLLQTAQLRNKVREPSPGKKRGDGLRRVGFSICLGPCGSRGKAGLWEGVWNELMRGLVFTSPSTCPAATPSSLCSRFLIKSSTMQKLTTCATIQQVWEPPSEVRFTRIGFNPLHIRITEGVFPLVECFLRTGLCSVKQKHLEALLKHGVSRIL